MGLEEGPDRKVERPKAFGLRRLGGRSNGLRRNDVCALPPILADGGDAGGRRPRVDADHQSFEHVFSLWVAPSPLKDYNRVIYSLRGKAESPKKREGRGKPAPLWGSSQTSLVVFVCVVAFRVITLIGVLRVVRVVVGGRVVLGARERNARLPVIGIVVGVLVG